MYNKHNEVGEVDNRTISPKELGALLGKSAEWARSLVRNGRIQATKDFGYIMIPITEVDRILSEAERREG